MSAVVITVLKAACMSAVELALAVAASSTIAKFQAYAERGPLAPEIAAEYNIEHSDDTVH